MIGSSCLGGSYAFTSDQARAKASPSASATVSGLRRATLSQGWILLVWDPALVGSCSCRWNPSSLVLAEGAREVVTVIGA